MSELLMMVRLACRNLLCSVELLDQKQANQLMRENKRGKRPYQVSTAFQVIIHPERATDDDRHRSRRLQLLQQDAGEGRGIKQLAGLIQQYYVLVGP